MIFPSIALPKTHSTKNF